MKDYEKFARNVIERELKCSVEFHDDGSQDSMYDLRIGAKEAPEVAIECRRAMNQEFTESWMVGAAKGSFRIPSLRYDWMVETRVDARIKQVKAEIETILKGLEALKVYHFNELWQLRDHKQLETDLESLGITSAHRVERVDPTGKVTLLLPGIGGAVDDNGTDIPRWIAAFLNDEDQADVLHKLRISGALKCHVFVPIGFSGAPFAVESYFTGDLERLPDEIPALPLPVDCVWLCGMGKKGVWWNGSEWRFFRTDNE